MRRSYRALMLLLLLGGTLLHSQSRPDPYENARKEMVELIKKEVKETRGYLGREALSQTTVDAMQGVKRHEFVPAESRRYAYENRPLPIGYGQTISQPYIVAFMTEALRLEGGETVLEVGTGSGYQAAVLAEIASHVYSIEIVPALADESRRRLAELGYGNVEVRAGDGYQGWPEAAPFDAILVTAAAPGIPPRLVEQLKPGGVLVMPLGGQSEVQQLIRLDKQADGSTKSTTLIPVRFVPLVHPR
jgi:protein-L-isoaspartate(D-aspartate) O-methyltransferase